jgi:alcohol dehydrogenase (cytochrome c)
MTGRAGLLKRGIVGAALAASVAAFGSSWTTVIAQVSFDRLLRAAQEPQNWLTYSGTTMSQRYSLLTQVTAANVKNLEQQWVFQAQSLEKFEATPLVVDGVIYTVQAPNDVVALDALTGRAFWIYSHVPSPQARPCCGRVNRGLAILGNTLFMATLDDHLIALDARSGRLVWNVTIKGARPEAGYAFTVAPLVVKNSIIVGVAGAEFGVRGFLAAFDATTGREVWRFNTVPGPGEPGNGTWSGDSWKRGGASVWVTGSYDPDLNLTYWGLGNPGPDWNGASREGDNLYSDGVVALDADTGTLKWHFQFTPHDEMDYDSTQVPVLADLEWQGRIRKVMLWANRNGFLYVLDRASGQFLLGKPFVKVTWASGLDDKGRPVRVQSPSEEGVVIFPHAVGGTNWMSPSFSPRTGLFYIPSLMDSYATFPRRAVDFVEGRVFVGAFPVGPIPTLHGGPINRRIPEQGYGAIQAFDPRTGTRKWIYRLADLTDSGVLSTASDLVFAGSREGYFFALDARDGSLLWKANLGGNVASGPIAYAVNGRQYVAVSAGNSLFAYALR